MDEQNERAAQNTDKEIWRAKPGDYYSPSIHVTKDGNVGMNVGGQVFVAPVETWHKALPVWKLLQEAVKRLVDG